ncbi:hypothetical protein H0H87_011248, partial [Tephrocybe sp. NHM501043]
LRVEWLKSRARAARFREEVDLLQEEMRRVLSFLAWQADFWRKKAETSSHLYNGPRAGGLAAYAHRQAALRSNLAARFSDMWRPLPHLINEAHASIANARASLPSIDAVNHFN